MPIPDFQTFMRPLLKSISNGLEHDLKEVKKILIKEFSITDEELQTKIPSQRAYLFDNRLGWANTYLKKAGLIASQKRGFLQITEQGTLFLNEHPSKIKVADLKNIDAFKNFHTANGTGTAKETPEVILEDTEKSPEEIIDTAYNLVFNGLVVELLSTIQTCTPGFFEKLVVDLLITMGYGGSRKEAGRAIGKSGDGGIDGIIHEDKLGLDSIYIQAKRYKNTVPIGEVRDFAGSLLGKKARKGVFITTSDFPKSAYEFTNSIEPKIILIDGEKLASLMIEHNVGITVKDSYIIKGIDNDYFEEN